MKHTRWRIVVAIGLLSLAAFPQDKPAETGNSVFIIPVVGEINYTQNAFVRRGVADALAARPELVIIEIDSPGGRGDAMMAIGVQVLKLKAAGIKAVAFIRPVEGEDQGGAWSAAAYIAMCCQQIYMYPGTVIGAATPIMMSQAGIVELPEKFISAYREKFGAIAEVNDYPVNLAIAMVDEDWEVHEVKVGNKILYLTPNEIEAQKNKGNRVEEMQIISAAGKILTLRQKQAVTIGMAQHADGRDDIYADFGIKTPVVTQFTYSWSEGLVSFLMSPALSTILMLVGVLGIWLEMKTPGFGVPGIVGVLAFSILLFGQHLAGLAEAGEILLFVAGIALLAVEIFLIPGTGIFAIFGVICIFSGLILSFQDFVIPDPALPEQMDVFVASIGRVCLSMLGSSILFIVLIRFMHKIPLANRLILQTELTAESGAVAPSQQVTEHLIGKTGLAVTPLRPGGKIEIGGTVYDVVAEGDFVEMGKPVTVITIDGARIVVEAVRKA